MTPFEQELKDLLAKHKKVIYAAPTYVQNHGVWQTSAELMWADVPEPKTPPKESYTAVNPLDPKEI